MSNVRAGFIPGVLASLALAGCSAAEDEAAPVGSDGDFERMVLCGEARGSLLEFSQMSGGSRRVDTSTLSYAATNFRNLADKVSAPGEVTQDLEAWRAAIGTWSDARTAMPPNIVEGRLIEPDTSEIDGALMQDLQPRAERIGTWVAKVCDG